MLKDSTLFNLMNREIGQLANIAVPRLSATLNLTVSFIQKTFKTHNPNASIVWLSARFNLVLTLDSKGRLACHNAVKDFESFPITSPNEHAYKCFFAGNSLFIISQLTNQSSIFFYKIFLSDLQDEKVIKNQMFPGVETDLDGIKCIEEKSGCIVIQIDARIQIWNAFENRLLHEFPYNPSLIFQLTSNRFVFWESKNTTTSIGVLSLDTSELNTVVINGSGEVYICELVQGKLVVGIKGYHLQIIDLKTTLVEFIKKGNPESYYQMQTREAYVVIFRDGSAVIIDKDITEVFIGRDSYMCCDISGTPIFCNALGTVFISGRAPTQFNFFLKQVLQIGVNLDTHQIFMAEKGVISIIE